MLYIYILYIFYFHYFIHEPEIFKIKYIDITLKHFTDIYIQYSLVDMIWHSYNLILGVIF